MSLLEGAKLLLGEKRTYSLGIWSPGVSLPNIPEPNQSFEWASFLDLFLLTDGVHDVIPVPSQGLAPGVVYRHTEHFK